MIRIRNFFFICLALIGLSCSISSPATATPLAEYQQSGVTVSASDSWPPYSFIGTDGTPTGYFIDFWKTWSEKTKVPVSFRLVPWNKTIELIAKGECDIQSGLFFTHERSKQFTFSQPVFFGEAVLVVGQDIDCNQDLSTLRWGGVTGSVEADYPRKHYPDAEFISFNDSYAMFRALTSGKIQAAIEGWSTAVTLQREMETIKVCQTVYRQDLLAMILKDRNDLLGVINSGLAQITTEERDALVNRWFIDKEPQCFNWGYFAALAIVALLAIVCAIYFATRRS